MPWIDDELLHLVEGAILHHIVDSPWPIPYFEISTIRDLFGEGCDLLIEVCLICLALDTLDHIRRVMCLGTESIDDTDSFRAKQYCLRNLRCKSISSLREDDLTIFTTRLGLSNEMSKTRTHAPILIDREECSINRLECSDYSHTELFILERLYSSFCLSLLVIVDDDPELIRMFERQIQTLDMSRVDRVGIHRGDSESSHRFLD